MNAQKQKYRPIIPNHNTADHRLECINSCFSDEFPANQADDLTQEITFAKKLDADMNTDPEDLTVKEKIIETEDTNVIAVCTNDYNCMCEMCQSKYGSLPLLLQGIEQKSFTEKDNVQPQASTSSAQVPISLSTQKKSLICQYCNKHFNHRGDFNKHLRKHTKEQPFSCSVCDRKFAHTSNLQRHLRLHSGQKPYNCQNCYKSFSRKDKLESHKRSKLCQASATESID